MSTKVYYGIRFPASDLNKFSEAAHRAITDVVAKEFAKSYEFWISNVLSNSTVTGSLSRSGREQVDFYLRELADGDQESRERKMYYALEVACVVAHNTRSSEHNLVFNDAGFVLHYHNGFFYGWPYGILHNKCGKLVDAIRAEVESVEDFAYWDNVEKPEDVSDNDWILRGQLWNEATASFPVFAQVFDWTGDVFGVAKGSIKIQQALGIGWYRNKEEKGNDEHTQKSP